MRSVDDPTTFAKTETQLSEEVKNIFFHPFGSAEAASVLLFEVLFEKCQRQNSCKWKFKKPSSPHLQHKKLGVCQGSTDVRFKSNQMLEYSTRYFYKMTGKAKRG